MSLISRFDPAGTFLQGGSHTGSIEGCWGGASFNYASWTANDDLTVINKLRQAVIGSDFNPAVSLGEAKESLGTILHGANALAGAIYHAKRGDFVAAGKSLASYERNQGRGAKAVGRVAARNNLQVTYGIKPILRDVYNAATSLAHLTSAPFQDVITVTHRRDGLVKSASPTNVAYSGYCFKSKRIKFIRKEVDVIHLIGLTDPAVVLWELLPYSFVADWFIPIGDFLQARGVAQSLTGTFVTSTLQKGHAVSPRSVNATLVFPDDSALKRYSRRETSVTRTISSSLSVPLPTIKPLSDWATWKHAADAVSLVTSGLFGKAKRV